MPKIIEFDGKQHSFPDDFTDADGHDTKVISPKMDDWPRDEDGEKAGCETAQRYEPQNRNAESGVDDGGGIGAHGINGGVPQVEEPREVVNAADTDRLDKDPLAAGLEAIAVGFSLRFPEHLENLKRQFDVYDALYAWCRLDAARSAG